MSYAHRAREQRSGPSRSWFDRGRELEVSTFYSVTPDEMKKTARYVASSSSNAEECANFLSMLGINIQDVHP